MTIAGIGSVATASSKPLAQIYIDSDGVPHVRVETRLSAGINSVNMPTTPIVETIAVILSGQELPFIYDDKSNTLYIVSTADANCSIEYVANASIENNVFSLSLSKLYVYRLLLAPNIILVTVPNNISGYGYVNNSILYIEFSDEPAISYIVKAREYTQTQQLTPVATAPKTTQIMLSTALIIVVVVLAAVAVFMAYLYMSRIRGGKKEELELLSDVDIAILKSLEKRGGSALQSELQKDVPIPRTTLWRHVKKLERLGYVKVEKVGPQNRVVLVKKPRLSS